MNSKTIFAQVEEIIRLIILQLNIQRKILHKSCDSDQRVIDLNQGLVRKKGILIPLSFIEHRILFDGYEAQFLVIFLKLYEYIFDNKNTLITQFTIRTLIEMSFNRAQILFSQTITNDEKNKYKLLMLLADYGFISFENHFWLKEYEKLYSEYRHLLSIKQQLLFDSLLKSIKTKNSEENKLYVVRARKLIDSFQDQLYKKTNILPLFRPINIYAMFSSFSHILHGNILLIDNMLSSKDNPKQHLLRIYWTLLLSGVNMINQIANSIHDDKIKIEVDLINQKFIPFSNLIKVYWEQIGTN